MRVSKLRVIVLQSNLALSLSKTLVIACLLCSLVFRMVVVYYRSTLNLRGLHRKALIIETQLLRN